MDWHVRLHNAFEAEFLALVREFQTEPLAVAKLLAEFARSSVDPTLIRSKARITPTWRRCASQQPTENGVLLSLSTRSGRQSSGCRRQIRRRPEALL